MQRLSAYMLAKRQDTAIRSVRVSAYTVPTDGLESDGTLLWDKTTLVLAEIEAGGQRGLGFSYASKASGQILHETLSGRLVGGDCLDIPSRWREMVAAIRNLGRPGAGLMAVSAADFALWDLKSKLFGVPLSRLLGRAREAVPVYGSGGFTSYSDDRLEAQLAGWVMQGIPRVKMKIGRDPARDLTRIRAARRAIGQETELFVDANGAYSVAQAIEQAQSFSAYGVRWLEEPVSSDDLEGLRRVRDRVPVDIRVAAGEYGWDAPYFRRMLAAGSVDVLQADATRCGGITGFLQAAALCDAFMTPLSAHTAPSMHAAVCCACPSVVHLEYFHDHVRIENELFDGVPELVGGRLRPDESAPGFGLELKRGAATRYAA